MIKFWKNKHLIVGFSVFAILLTSSAAHAMNGIRLIGVGAIHRGLGGAGVAKPLDTTAVLLNPAGMNNVGDQFDLGLMVGLPTISMNSATMGGNNTTSQDEAALIPSASIVFSLLDDRLAFGVGSFVTCAFGVDYRASRLPTAVTNNTYDTASRYGLMKFIPAVSYQIIDNLYVGAGLHIDYAFIHSNSGTTAAGFPETSGRSRFDPALGIGGNIGIIYEPLEWFSFGATYTTRQYFENFERYNDLLLGSMDMPQEVNAGFAFKPFEGALVLTDFRWINWSGVGTVGNAPANGGFGWQDQYVGSLGLQYNFNPRFTIPLTVRLGYNYGRSFIQDQFVYQNLLVPAITEHHITAGLGYDITEKIAVNVSYSHFLEHSQTDNGTVNAPGGASVKMSAHSFTLQLGVDF